jgi:hypothetical protein
MPAGIHAGDITHIETEAVTVPILTDVANGDDALAPYLDALDGEWELVVSGEGSQSHYNDWDCAFYVQRSPRTGLYGLLLADFGDPSYREAEDEPEAVEKIVAVWPDPPAASEDEIVRSLLRKYEEDGGKFVDTYNDVGRFDLDE